MKRYKVIIVGAGPAGLSAAYYTVRAGIETLIIGRDGGALETAHKIENYFGFSGPVSGKQLISNSLNNAVRLGAHYSEDEVVEIGYGDPFIVFTKSDRYTADSLILATGASRATLPIPGLKRLEGRGVSYCAVCDAFFYRNKAVAVVGNGAYALHEATILAQTASNVTILTNGKPPAFSAPSNIQIDERPIHFLLGEDVLDGIELSDQTVLKMDGLFVAVGVAGSADLARKLGAQVEGNLIMTDETMATTIPGLFAAGDCTGGLLQIAKAAADGALAGTGIIRYLRHKKPLAV